MTIATFPKHADTFAGSYAFSVSEERFDDGLEHGHHWAKDSSVPARDRHPVVANAAAIRTPSTALHDDFHHAI